MAGKTMIEEIEKWRQVNGNITYTTKELIEGLHIKIDSMNSKINNSVVNPECVRKRREIKSMIVGMFSFAITCISALAWYILK